MALYLQMDDKEYRNSSGDQRSPVAGYQTAPPPPYSKERDVVYTPIGQQGQIRSTLEIPPVEPSQSTPSPNLPKPIAIPATLAKYGSPFLRAYPVTLARYSISHETFLTFLDALNRVAIKSPPLQVLSLASNVAGFVPSAAVQTASGAIGLVSDVAAGIFGARGLKVEIAKTEALARLTGIPDVLDSSGKLIKNARLLMTLEGEGARLDTNSQQRRLDAMSPWIAELDLTPLPEIEVPASAMGRLSMKASERERAKGEKKLLESRGKTHEGYEKDSRKAQRDFDDELAKLDKELKKDLRKVEDDLAKAIRKRKDVSKVEREREKVLAGYTEDKAKLERRYHKDMQDVEKDRSGGSKEEKSLRKLYWLIIRPLDGPTGAPNLPGRQ